MLNKFILKIEPVRSELDGKMITFIRETALSLSCKMTLGYRLKGSETLFIYLRTRQPNVERLVSEILLAYPSKRVQVLEDEGGMLM